MSLNMAIIYGSVRTERQGIRAARFMVNTCQTRGYRCLPHRSPALSSPAFG